MELVTTLYEKPNLQILNIKVREVQNQYDEVRAMTLSIAPVKHLVKLQEGKKLLAQVQATQNK